MDDFIFQIVVGIQKLIAIFIDRFALLVCDVVVFEDMFTRLKMQALDLFLRIFYGARNHSRFNMLAVFQTQAIHDIFNLVASENSKQVILQA